MLGVPFRPVLLAAPRRVVYVVDEPGRCGFAHGTLPGAGAGVPPTRESAWTWVGPLDEFDDGPVWITEVDDGSMS